MNLPQDDPAAQAAHCAALLRKSVSSLSRRLRPPAMPEGLSLAKLSALGQLYRGGPISATELARREGVKIQSLTRLLAELEAAGWLVRKAHASDGRRSLLCLTRQGVKRLAEATLPGEAALARTIAAKLSASERALLLRACGLMDALEQSLSQGGAQEQPS